MRAFFFIIFSGIILRLLRLNDSLWTDEFTSYKKAILPFSSMMKELRNDFQSPLFEIFLHFLIPITGDSEPLLRILPLLFGILCIPMIFLLGKLLYNSSTGLFAAGIMAFSFQPIYYSQELRPYSLLIFLSLCVMYTALNVSKDLGSKKWATLYLLAIVLCSYTHYFGFYFVLWIILLTSLVTKKKVFHLLNLISLILYLPWLSSLTLSLNSPPDWLMNTPRSFIENLEFYSDFSFGSSSLLTTFLLTLFLLFIFQSIRKKKGFNSKDYFLIFLWFVPYLITDLICQYYYNSNYAHRYFSFALPMAYLLMSRCFHLLFENKNLRMASYLVLILLLTYDLREQRYFTQQKNDEIREIVSVPFSENVSSFDVFVFFEPPEFFAHYGSKFTSSLPETFHANHISELELVNYLIEAPPYIWALVGSNYYPKAKLELIEQFYQIKQEKGFPNSRAILFEKRSHSEN